MSIGIFDSGFGGLTVMRKIRDVLPKENIIYFGDTARLPYGNKSADVILRYSLESTHFLLEQGIKLLVIACHTVCTAALEEIERTVKIPVIGIVEAGIESIIAATQTKKIAILGTRRTISSGFYQEAIQRKVPDMQIFATACPLFVPIIEEGYGEHPLMRLIAQEYLRPLRDKNIDAALLACTHYPLLQKAIQEELGEEILLVDPGLVCAQKIKQTLSAQNALNLGEELPHYQFFVSDDPEKFRLFGNTFLNYPIEHILTHSL